VEDAREKAAARAAKIARKVALGAPLNRDGYCDRPLREETKEAVQNRFRDEVGIVTRIAYGELVLNATDAMFIDIDIPGIHKRRRSRSSAGRRNLSAGTPISRRSGTWKPGLESFRNTGSGFTPPSRACAT
jgi:hypothetical protein